MYNNKKAKQVVNLNTKLEILKSRGDCMTNWPSLPSGLSRLHISSLIGI